MSTNNLELTRANEKLQSIKRNAAHRPLPRSARTKSKAGRHRKLQAKEIEKIRSQYSNGNVSLRSLAHKHHTSPATMHSYLAGIPKKSLQENYGHKIPKDTINIVVNLYRSGLSMAALAEKFHVSKSTIWRTIRLRAKVTANFPRLSRAKSKELAKRQPAIKIDRRIGKNKRKRGVKHDINALYNANDSGRRASTPIKQGRIATVKGKILDSIGSYDTYNINGEEISSDPDEIL